MNPISLAFKEAAKKAVDDNWSRYSPVPGYPSLRKAIVEKLKRENGLEFTEAQISVSNGAKHSLINVFVDGNIEIGWLESDLCHWDPDFILVIS